MPEKVYLDESGEPIGNTTPTVFGMAAKPELADALEGVEAQGGPLMPPAGAAAVAGIGRAMTSGGGGMARAWATAKAAADAAAPSLKYEAAKMALEGAGLPTALAMPIAMVVSGVKRGARTPAPTAAPAPAPAAPAPRVPANATSTTWGHVSPESVLPKPAARVLPAASTPGAPASPAATSAPQSAPTLPAAPRWSPQRIRNEVGLAERRSGLKLTEAQREQADQLVAKGLDPKAAVQSVVPTPVATPAPPPAAAGPKPSLSAAETKVFHRLLSAGKTPEQAYASIELQRGLAARLGTPSPEKVRQAVAERNATGRWRKE